MTSTRAKITSNGQISLPARLRHRWSVDSLLVVDRGDYAIVLPVPDDIVGALKGSRRGAGPMMAEARAAVRADEATAARPRTAR